MRRYQGIEIVGPDGEDDGDEGRIPEGRFYLIRVHHLTKGWERFELSRTPGRKNLSHQECVRGWLGATNDVSRTAKGCVELTRRDGKLAIKTIDPSVLAQAEELDRAE